VRSGLGAVLVLLAALPAAMAHAQAGNEADAIDARVAAMVANAGESYRAAPEQPSCGGSGGGDNDIVVCGREDSARWRVKSSRETDPTSRESLRDGVPRAPQLDRGSCKGQAGCMIGGWAPPPIYYIDLKAIPEAPAGSDADKVAKGEMADR